MYMYSVSTPGQLVKGTRSVWIELRYKAEDLSLQSVGLEFRVNITALCSCSWYVDYVWFRNLTFTDMEHLKSAYNSDQTIKERLERYGNAVLHLALCSFLVVHVVGVLFCSLTLCTFLSA